MTPARTENRLDPSPQLKGRLTLRFARQRGGGAWISGLIARKKPKVAAVAVANKSARIAWALMARGEVFTPRPA